MLKQAISCGGSATVHVVAAGEDQVYITVQSAERAGAGDACRAAYREIAVFLRDRRMHIVHERLFGSLENEAAVRAARQEAMQDAGVDPNTPVTYIGGRPLWGEGFAGALLRAVQPSVGPVQTLTDDQRPYGRIWQRHGATFLTLQNMHGFDPNKDSDGNSRKAQAERMFQRADAFLRARQASYCDVVRTWIYLPDILTWYDEFNRVRNAQYSRFGILPDLASPSAAATGRLPASTGIQGKNALGAACLMDLLAVMGGRASQAAVVRLSSAVQLDAFYYGSAFSRGVAVRERDVTHVEISGTAAIDEAGRTAWPGDVRRQIEKTLQVIEALLAQQRATLDDLAGVTAFLKRPEDAAVYTQVMAERGLADAPTVCVIADVCRPDLLFEMDGVAVAAT